MRSDRVTVDTSSLLRAWVAVDHAELWFQFERGDGDGDATEVVSRAVEAANERLDDAIPANEESGRFAYCEGPWRLPITPNAYAIYMKRPGTEDGVVAWLETFAEVLDDAGLRGRVRAASWPRSSPTGSPT